MADTRDVAYVRKRLCNASDLMSEVFVKVEDISKENTKLKKLLKECRDEIEYLRKHYKGRIDHLKNNTRLDKEINQVLQENE